MRNSKAKSIRTQLTKAGYDVTQAQYKEQVHSILSSPQELASTGERYTKKTTIKLTSTCGRKAYKLAKKMVS